MTGFMTGRESLKGRTLSRKERSAPDKLKIMCFSWNVGNAEPTQEQLKEWLPDCLDGPREWDVIVVGTQENAFKLGKKKSVGDVATVQLGRSTDGEEDEPVMEPKPGESAGQGEHERDASHWDKMVSTRLGRDYAVVKQVVLWEMRLTVYAKRSLLSGSRACVSHVQSAISATGVAGVLGNKGGLVVRMNVGTTSLAFVSCHLAAHAPMLAKRNQNCQEILRETQKSLGTRRLDASSQFDHVFWIGDLNYRIDLNAAPKANGDAEPYPEDGAHHAAVTALVDGKQYEALYAADQLLQCQQKGEAFAGYVETPPQFAPTFKVKRVAGTEYKLQRVPSYCDRVLTKSMPPLAPLLSPLSFTNLPNVSTSDHKPVMATFELTTLEGHLKQLKGAAAEADAVPSTPRGGVGGFFSFLTNRAPGVGTARAPQQPPPPASTGSDGRPLVPPLKLASLKYAPLVRVNHLKLTGLRDTDFGGGCDPYCIFYTNPSGLFSEDRYAPISTWKSAKGKGVKGSPSVRTSSGSGGAAAAEPGGVMIQELDSREPPPPMKSSPSSPLLGGIASSNAVVWEDAHELPLLRLRVSGSERLPYCTMIIAVFDHDMVGADDLLGVALVPLTPPGFIAGKESTIPQEYELQIDQPLTFGNVTKDVGVIQGSLTVSFGEKLEPALAKAAEDKVGASCRNLSQKGALCGCLNFS